jgi:four helix bundle protein
MAKTLQELAAFQLSRRFKLEVYRLFRTHPEARTDLKYLWQLREAVRSGEANVAEGWRRYRARDMARFLRFALASNEEAQVRLRDGIDCEYFTEAECELAFELGRRSGAAIMGLLKSLDDVPPPQPKNKRGNR